jgi:6-phosphogluconolactonase
VTLWHLYVGTFTKEFGQEIQQLNATTSIFWRGSHPGLQTTPATGLERFSFDDRTGTLRYVDSTTCEISTPQYIALHPRLPVVYAAEFGRPSRLSAFAIRADGTLERVARPDSLGELAIAVSVHPSGEHAYVAHWGDGSLTSFQLDANGVPGAPHRIAPPDRHSGPAGSQHHEVCVAPGGNGVLVTDIGSGELVVYAADEHGALSSVPTARISFPAGCAPRHLEFHPSGRFVYMVGEQDSMLHVLEAEDGLPTKILASHSTRPHGHDGSNVPSELHLHPDGRTLYVGNRGSNHVTIFSVDGSGGVEPLGQHPSLGRSPRAVRVDPTGKYLVVANRDSGGLMVLEIGRDRLLSPVGEPVEARAPSSIVFVRATTDGALATPGAEDVE